MNRLFSLSVVFLATFLLLTSTYKKASATIVAYPLSYDFGVVAIGYSVSTNITVSNTNANTASITVSTTNSEFSITPPTSFTLSPGGIVDVEITYTPSIQGDVSAFLDINDTTGLSIRVSLSGYGHSLRANPVSHDFGDVEVGSSSTIIISISNQYSSQNTITNVNINPPGGDFNITSVPGIPLTLYTGNSFEVEITYTPSDLGHDLADLIIQCDVDQARPLIVQLDGNGVPVDPVPEERITEILELVEQFVAEGTLSGRGAGNSANGRLKAITNMLLAVSDHLQNGERDKACNQLWDVYDRCDGEHPPPNFIEGISTSIVNGMIMDLLIDLDCI